MVKNPPASAEDARDPGSVPGPERCPGGGRANPLQHSCLENRRDRGAGRAAVHGITKDTAENEHSKLGGTDLRCLHKTPERNRKAEIHRHWHTLGNDGLLLC